MVNKEYRYEYSIVKCKCDNYMDLINEQYPSRTYGTDLIFWCPFCGKLMKIDDNHLIGEATWFIPSQKTL